jgi:HSP20 family molecular chaperone IbpA
MAKKASFFERLTGSVRLDQEDDLGDYEDQSDKKGKGKEKESAHWAAEEPEEGQLSVDVYQTPNDIIIETMVAGVKPEDLQINIMRDMVTLRGKREPSRIVNDEDYFTRELFWGTFSRTISLPAEIEPEDAEAIEKHGLLMIRLPKIDKSKQTSLRVKSI